MSINWSKALRQRGGSLLCGLGILGMLLSGCNSTKQPKFVELQGVTTVPAASSPAENTDVLQPGQPVLITITDLPMLVPPVNDQIKTDGTITLLQNKTFTAAGKTRRQLEQEVHDFYVPNFYKQMTVTIQAQQATRFYYVDGEVKQPARQVYMGPTTVLKAIASAQGLTDFANRRSIKLIHSDGRIQVVNYNKAISHPELDLPVYPDDKVIVPRRLLW
jgi:polysaccharide biosynthesis/export protein